MSEDAPDGYSRDELLEEGLLQTFFQELSEEYRSRNRLLQNTFYLLIISAGVIFGLFVQFGESRNFLNLGILIVFTGMVSTIIGHLFLKHFHDRESAQAVRMYVEQTLNEDRENPDRALSFTHGVIGGSIPGEGGEIYRRGSYMHYILKIPESFQSAETLGIGLILVGAVLPPLGAAVATLYYFDVAWGVLSALLTQSVILGLYRYAINQAEEPGKEPIYPSRND